MDRGELSNSHLYVYVVLASNTTIPFEKFLISKDLKLLFPYVLPDFTSALACLYLRVNVLLATQRPTAQQE